MVNSVWVSPAALVLPIVAGGLLLRPASLLGAVRGRRDRADRGVRATRPVRGRPVPGDAGHRARRRGLRFLRPAHRAVPQPGRRPLAARRHHALRPARTHPRAEQVAAAAEGLAPRDGAAAGGRPVLLRRLRGRGPYERRTHPGGRPHGRVRQGHGRGLARPAPVRRLRRPAGLAAAARASSPPPTATCSARTGTRASPPPIHLVLDLDSGDYELFSAGHLPGLQLSAGSGRWEEKAAEGPLLGVYDGRPVRPGQGLPAAGRRPDALHGRPGGDAPTGISSRASTASRARPTATWPAASTARPGT